MKSTRNQIAEAMASLLEHAKCDSSRMPTISELAATAGVSRGTLYNHADLLAAWRDEIQLLPQNNNRTSNYAREISDLRSELHRIKTENKLLRENLKSLQTVAAELAALNAESENSVVVPLTKPKRI